MLRQIFIFELKYRLKKPGIYIYFLFVFFTAMLNFGFGALPLNEKQFINSPASISFYVAMLSMVLMLASSAIMGVPLYRDIEYNTKEYYLSYPITKAGYFWGRYLASFSLVMLLAVGLLLGIWVGTIAGPAFGWQDPARFQSNRLSFYLHPFFTLALPNLFFTSSLFFGLVAILKNEKVIYSSGIILLLGYLIANFFVNSSSSPYVIYLTDPFAINGVKWTGQNMSVAERNNNLFPITGLLLVNRCIWVSVGIGILLYTWLRFSFEKFFGAAREKETVSPEVKKIRTLPDITVDFKQRYNRPVLYTLTHIEVLNIIRDNYFWIIIGAGSIFLGIIFSHGPGNFGIRDYPRTSMILFLFNNNFMIFIFCVIIFYTGEVIHRERSTRYNQINDALPPSVLLLNGAKILSILCLSVFLTVLPMIIGMIAQLSRGYYLFNFPAYFKVLVLCTFPKLVLMTMLSFLLHICIRNKFAALGVGISYSILCTLAVQSGYFNYNLLLYSFTPFYGISDFDNIGHMVKAISWFNIYWLLLGGLFLVAGYLFYVRGTISSFKERVQLAKERFRGKSVLLTGILVIAFILTAAFNYYNVSYLNHYYTNSEELAHKAMIEKILKRYESMPLPKITAIKMFADLFPDRQEADFRSVVTIVNKTNTPIKELLLDGNNITSYSLKYNNSNIPFTCPLFFPRGKFNFFGPSKDSSTYRLYQLPKPLAHGDTAMLEIISSVFYTGFANDLYGVGQLENGLCMPVALPGLGYDRNDEIRGGDDRKTHGLAQRPDDFEKQIDSEAENRLLTTRTHDLISFELTISTYTDQKAIAPGTLVSQWEENGRNYYRYTANEPGIYTDQGILSARYAELHDSVRVDSNRYVSVDLYYHPTHNANLHRFLAAYKDGLKYYSSAFGPYPFKQVRLAEAPVYAPGITSMAGTDVYAERFGFNADFSEEDQFDYCYYITAKQLAEQWWGNQVAPNHMRSSELITKGLTKYCALVLYEKRYGKDNIRTALESELNNYLWGSRWNRMNQQTLLKSGSWSEFENKAAIVLYSLKDLAGETVINAALREFRNAYAFKSEPPFAGAKELYAILKKHVPDSVQYYLTDTWENVSYYNNRIIATKVVPLSQNNQFKVSIKLSTEKLFRDSTGNDISAKNMNDYIDIGVFAEDSKNNGRMEVHPLYLQKHKLSSGEHTIEVTVTGKPVRVGIDPYLKLIDRIPGDNVKNF